jgi:hypothetical protein
MVAIGCRVVTQRGLIPIEFVLEGEEVLTHKKRFRKVRSIRANIDKGPFIAYGPLKATEDINAARTWDDSFTPLRSLGAWEAVSAVEADDWAEAERRSLTLDQRPRGMVISSVEPQIVLGVSPETIFGRILFASDLGGKATRDDFEFYEMESIVLDLTVDEDDSFVCERLALRGSRV